MTFSRVVTYISLSVLLRRSTLARSIAWAIALALLLPIANTAHADLGCEVLSSWQARPFPQGASAQERVQWSQERWSLQKKTASQLVDAYRESQVDWSAIEQCLSGEIDRGNFYALLQDHLYRDAVQRLAGSRGGVTRFIADRLNRSMQSSPLMLFRLAGSSQIDLPTGLPAGFHRGSGSVVVDLKAIPSRDFLVLFAHEMIHAMDQRLFRAIEEYSSPDFLNWFSSVRGQKIGLMDLTQERREAVDHWIRAGLDRGLLAEYRAWVVTGAVYGELKQDQIVSQIPWLSRFLGGSESNTKELSRSVFRALDPKFTDPDTGFFEEQFLKDALGVGRDRLRADIPVQDVLSAFPPGLDQVLILE